MFIITSSRLVSSNICNLIKRVRFLSAQSQTQAVTEHEEGPRGLYHRKKTKLPQRKPIMKNCFLGELDTDILGFPEVLNNEEAKNLDKIIKEVKQSVSNLPDYSIGSIKSQSKLFGLQCPKMYGGLELNETENARILEILFQNSVLGTTIVNHQCFGTNPIIQYGNKKLQDSYLPKMCTGEKLATNCFLEKDCLDLNLMSTKARMNDDESSWILNGKKDRVINGYHADIYFVLANTQDDNSAVLQDKLNLLFVDRTINGVKAISCSNENTSLQNLDIADISFCNTAVPIENMFGEQHNGQELLYDLMKSYHLSSGPACITLMQKLIDNFNKYVLQISYGSFKNTLADTDLIKNKISKMNINLYIMESMTYVTAGLLDKYENQDCELELTILKVFCIEKSMEMIQECMNPIGNVFFTKDHWLYDLHKDILTYALMHENVDILRTCISLLGLQYAGKNMNDTVVKLRNPLFNPGYALKKIFSQNRQANDNPKLKNELQNYLHPSLINGANFLEYSISRLEFVVETMLVRSGAKIIERHMELDVLANIVTDIYAMICVLSRASRSYCIGLQNAETEISLANTFCLDARNRISRNVQDLWSGPYVNNDVNYVNLADRALKNNGYFAVHPLTKNF